MVIKGKVVHILPDRKFITQIDKFRGIGIENKVVYWGEGGALPHPYHENAVYLRPCRENIPVAVSACSGASIVVVYSLLPTIVLKLPKETTVIWRFFGYEIYERKLKLVLSRKTYRIYRISSRKSRYSVYSIMKRAALVTLPMASAFNRSLKRVNYFMGVLYEEYQYIESLGFHLPPFLQSPIHLPGIVYKKFNKKDVLLLGNSRTFFNNHIDILDILIALKRDHGFKIRVPFSYGEDSVYTRAVKEVGSSIPNLEFIEEFVSHSEYQKIYQDASAVIINSFRQMALGNITIALRTGTKIYLSKNNVIFHWLKNNRFKVFSTDVDLPLDIRNGNLRLEAEDAEYNFEQLLALMRKYTIHDFRDRVIDILGNASKRRRHE